MSASGVRFCFDEGSEMCYTVALHCAKWGMRAVLPGDRQRVEIG